MHSTLRLSLRLAALLALAALAACASTAPVATSPCPAPASQPVSPSPSAAPPPSPAITDLEAKVDPLFAEYAKPNVPGCAVGVYRAGEVLFAKGYGSANLEHNLPIAKNTVFEIGSTSKQFTATAILLLAADGKLSLDDDVRKFIPELPAYARPITLRHLLHHTGGLREYDSLLSTSGYDVEDIATEAEALHLVVLQRGTNFPAGSEWSYSNTGYFLLGQVVRRVSGLSLAEFSRTRIFEPLGMTSTLILDDHTKLVPRRATSYARSKEGGFKLEMSYREETGEGNIQSSIEDLAKWDANFYSPKVGGETWLTTMRTPGKLDNGKALTYAMGLHLGTEAGLAIEEHSGGWAGYRAHILRVPSERLGVTVLCNVEDARPTALAHAVAALFVPKLAGEPKSSSPQSPLAVSPTPKVSAADAAPFEGTYIDTRSLETRTVSLKDGQLLLGFGDSRAPQRQLEIRNGRILHVVGANADYAFAPKDHAKPAHLVRNVEDAPPHTFERVVPAPMEKAALANYAGRYRSDEMTHDLELVVKDGGMRMGSLGKTLWDETLSPVAPGIFTAGGFGLRFEHDGAGKSPSFVLFMDGYPTTRWSKVGASETGGAATR